MVMRKVSVDTEIVLEETVFCDVVGELTTAGFDCVVGSGLPGTSVGTSLGTSVTAGLSMSGIEGI